MSKKELESNSFLWILSTLVIFLLMFGMLVMWREYLLVARTQQNVVVQPKASASMLPKMVEGDYKVVMREGVKGEGFADVYLQNLSTGEEIFYFTQENVYADHYHYAEYHNGTLYLIKRIGYDGYPDDVWTDELWAYDDLGEGKVLYSTKGLDFRVRADESVVAVFGEELLALLDNKGELLKVFRGPEVNYVADAIPELSFVTWGENTLWVANYIGPTPLVLMKIDLRTYEITDYDVQPLMIGTGMSLNPEREVVAYDNFPPLFDVESAEEYYKSGEKVNLVVYDLQAKEQKIVATAVTSPFRPKWVDAQTLEYDALDEGERLQWVIE